MKLFLENHNEIGQTVNVFDAKNDLANLMNQADDCEYDYSPIEAAALQLTMRQIDGGPDIPAVEVNGGNLALVLNLSHEDLKESIAKGWDAFVKAVRAVYQKIKDFFADIWKRLRRKKKAGDPNSSFEREGEEKTEDGEVTTPLEFKYKMKLAYFETGDVSDAKGFLNRIGATPKITTVISKLLTVFDTTIILKRLSEISKTGDDQAWDNYVNTLFNNLRGIMKSTNAFDEDGDLVVYFTEHFRLRMSGNNYPVLEVDDDEGTLEIPEDIKAYAKTLSEVNKIAHKNLEKFFIFAAPNMDGVNDEVLRKRLIGLMPTFNQRAKLNKDYGIVSAAILEAGEGVLADLEGTLNDQDQN